MKDRKKVTYKLKKIWFKICFLIIKIIKKFNEKKYVILYRKLLKKHGMNIYLDDYYIDPSCYFDDYDYSKITIKKSVIISREVLFLTHDYSVNVGLKNIDNKRTKNAVIIKPITIGEGSFIGARSILLPGTNIGKNVIVGAGAVVKGNIPDNSIIIGNPCKKVGTVKDYGKKHFELNDYYDC